MIDADLKRRVERLVHGTRRSDDLDRLFLALRERSYGRASIREIGDFVAHRDQREKGPVTQKVRDIFESFRSWARISVAGLPFTIADIRKVSAANLRVATDAQIEARLGLTRSVAKSVLEQALRNAENGKPGTLRERRVVDYFGSAFIWNPAFTAIEVLDDLTHVLQKAGLLEPTDEKTFAAIGPFLALYVTALMHGSAVILEDGTRADLFAGFANREERIEVKARLTINDLSKPIFAPICIFWTTLPGPEHSAPALADAPSQWEGPIEIGPDGKLGPIE